MSAVGDYRCTESPKRVKYDRQLRLWDDHGQSSLEAARICLINATATGTEILKSLVLPGVGSFTILDGKLITGEDAGNNFFLDKDSIGKSRAKVATEALLDLNPDVKGEFVDETVEFIIEREPHFFAKFTVVVATNVEERTLLKLADKLWDENIPLLVCRAYGMIGYMRLQFSDLTIVESKPENEFHDLRLDKPFPALQEYVDSVQLDSLTDTEHGHVPYVVILLKSLEQWKREHNGELPKNSGEKKMLKDEIMRGMRKKDEEENFEEAVRAVNRSVVRTEIPSDIQKILNDPSCDNLSAKTKPFWIMVKAMKDFTQNEGNSCLPLRGIIPDMTSDTQSYIKLQNIYKQKAAEDARAIYCKSQKILLSLGKPPNSITEQDIKTFCKNAHCLRVLQGRSIRSEHDSPSLNIQKWMGNLEHDDSDTVFYILLRAVDKFQAQYDYYPGQNGDFELDVLKLKNCLSPLLQEWNCPPLVKEEYVHEMCRYGGSELHSVAAFVGGCAAHEVIKLITGQYVPFNNTLIYYAVNQTTSVFCL